MRIVVVGGGVVGLLTAMECLRAGAEVGVVDRYEMPSPWAASYDRHRVVRALHRGDPALTRAAAGADQAWQDIERRLGGQLYHRVGAVTAMPPDRLRSELAMLADAGVPASWLSPAELAARYPRVRFPQGLSAVVEPAAGAVLADRLLKALVEWLAEHPSVELHPVRRVVEVEPGGVRLDDGSALEGDRIVVAAGPWSRELLPEALASELRLYRQSMLSYEPVPSRHDWAGTPAIPAFGTPNGAWLMPPVGDTPARLSAASACRVVDEMTDRVTPDEWRSHLVREFGALLTDFDPDAVVEAKDAYYLGGADGPLLATYGSGAVCAYAACGGMSFKFAPLIARSLAERCLGRRPRLTGLSWLDRPVTLIEGRTP
jgi:sarcosine oxidase